MCYGGVKVAQGCGRLSVWVGGEGKVSWLHTFRGGGGGNKFRGLDEVVAHTFITFVKDLWQLMVQLGVLKWGLL